MEVYVYDQRLQRKRPPHDFTLHPVYIFFSLSCTKTTYSTFNKINRVHLMVTCNKHTKLELNRMHHLDANVFIHIRTYTHLYKNTLTHIDSHAYTYITVKIEEVNSRDFKTYECVKSQSRIFSWLLYFPHIVYVRKIKIDISELFQCLK